MRLGQQQWHAHGWLWIRTVIGSHTMYAWCVGPIGSTGSPDDALAWFNLLPPMLSVKPLSVYYGAMTNWSWN